MRWGGGLLELAQDLVLEEYTWQNLAPSCLQKKKYISVILTRLFEWRCKMYVCTLFINASTFNSLAKFLIIINAP